MTALSHQDKLALVRQKCVEANPEIVELKPGCRVWFREQRGHGSARNPICCLEGIVTRMICKDFGGGKNPPMAQVFVDSMPNDLFQEEASRIRRYGKILGRHIRLADVLIAIRETPKTTKIVVDDGGRFWDFNRIRFTDCLWDLEHDDLDKQSEFTIAFLYALLCPCPLAGPLQVTDPCGP